MPRLARAALNSDRMRVLVSSRSKYRNVLSNCSSWAGVMLVMFLDTICHTSVCFAIRNGEKKYALDCR